MTTAGGSSKSQDTTQEALQKAATDLENAGFPGYAGKLFHPLREDVLVPAVSWMTASNNNRSKNNVPDGVGFFSVHLLSEFIKFAYKILPHDEQVDQEINSVLSDELTTIGHAGMYQLQKPKPLLSSLMGIVGFAANSVKDIVTLLPFTNNGNNNKLGEWATLTIQLFGYLLYAQVGRELVEAFGNPRGVANLAIIGNVQQQQVAANNNSSIGCESRRARTAMDRLPKGMTQTFFKNLMKDAARYVRYCSAAYGVSMIDSADLLQVFGTDVVVVPNIHSASVAYRKRKIANYLNVSEECILQMTPPGGSIELLGHFVAVDERRDSVDKNPAVVLAIRGTYTPSGLIIDSAAYSTKFCDGILAHSGIAKRANTLWDNVKDTVIKALQENPGYDLVISGHSLGAGAAALLAFKLNYEKLIEKEDPSLSGVKVECFAYACPPVFFQMCKCKDKKVNDAIQNTHAFVHENDCVPFMSVDSVRRLAETVTQVDECNKFRPLRRSLMAADQIEITPDIVHKVVEGSQNLEPVADAERLAIPAPFVIWMREIGKDKHDRPRYDVMFCRPQRNDDDAPGMNDLSVLMDWRMISDHMNPQYERAVNSIAERIIKKDEPYVFPVCK